MDLGLTGKTAIVTGASKGIGLAVARALVGEGANVIAASRKPPQDEPLNEHLRHVAVDMRDPGCGDALVSAAALYFGQVDALVNNVGGIEPRLGGFLSTADEDFVDAYTVNFLSAVRAARAALPGLLASSGAIVNVSSINAQQPDGSVVDYAASKAAMTNLTKALSAEFAPQGVRVNTVSPGPTRTPLWEEPEGLAHKIGAAMGASPQAAMEAVGQSMGGIAIGRFSEPEEIADAVVFPASPRASAVTGANWVVDGGVLRTV